jgi:general L-amino acid transport system substrate-binding protein
MKYQLVVGTSQGELVKAYATGGCTILTGTMSQLAIDQSKLSKPNDHLILPELAAKEPIGPVLRQGDEAWYSVVRWLLMALITAEELGVTKDTVDGMKENAGQDLQRLLGLSGGLGQALGLENQWAVEAIRQKGNYGELFERNFGAGSGLKLDRGLNQLWTKGGLMYSAPLR